jgi:hypothetical protein
MLVIFDMLVSLFERAYLVAYKPRWARPSGRWNSWDDYMREWCHREDFHNALPQLLRGEDPEFQDYIRRIAEEERGPIPNPCLIPQGVTPWLNPSSSSAPPAPPWAASRATSPPWPRTTSAAPPSRRPSSAPASPATPSAKCCSATA